MATITKTQAKKEVLNSVHSDFGKSFEELKKDIIKTLEFGATSHFRSENGYSIFYTENKNFMQGVANGGGKGWYARIHGVGVCNDIKIDN